MTPIIRFLIILVIPIFIFSCSSGQRVYREIDYAIESISPGSTIVKIEIMKLTSMNSQIKIEARVNKIFGYGAATKVVNEEDLIVLIMDKNLITGDFKEDNMVVLEIKQPEETIGVNNSTHNIWSVIRQIK